MSLHDDLLAQAQHLVEREPRRPKQASLRRGVSAAYYALFHLLIHESSRMLVTPAPLRLLIGRTFVHNEMNKACRSFHGGNLPRQFDSVTGGAAVPVQLRNVAKAFVDLQQARHEADYNLGKSFTRNEAQDLVNQVSGAFEDWERVRGQEIATVFLVSLLLWERFEKIPR